MHYVAYITDDEIYFYDFLDFYLPLDTNCKIFRTK